MNSIMKHSHPTGVCWKNAKLWGLKIRVKIWVVGSLKYATQYPVEIMDRHEDGDIKGVIVYVVHFWPPNFVPIYVRSLIYAPKSLLCTWISFLRIPPLVVSVRGHGEHVCSAWTIRGRAGSCGWWKIVRGCARGFILAHDVLIQSEARCRVSVRLPVLQGTGETSSTDHSWVRPCAVILIRPLIQLRTCKMGSSIFAAMGQLKFAITTRAPLPSMSSTKERTEKIVFVDCGGSYRAYPSSDFPNNPGAYPLPHTCRYLRQRLWVWRWIWRQSGVPISP